MILDIKNKVLLKDDKMYFPTPMECDILYNLRSNGFVKSDILVYECYLWNFSQLAVHLSRIRKKYNIEFINQRQRGYKLKNDYIILGNIKL